MRSPLVTVVIPAYNAAKYIAETLESVRGQTFRDYEIIVVDDGSTDDSINIAARFSGVRCLRQLNQGPGVARNTAIRVASGAYIAFLDADDLWMPDKLEKQMAYLEANPNTVWIYSDALVFDSATNRTICRIGGRLHLHQGDILRPLLVRSFIALATPVVKREALFATGLFDESPELRLAEDWDLWLRLAEYHPIALVNEPLARIRVHSENSSRKMSALDLYHQRRAMLKSAIARNPGVPDCVARRALADVSVSAGLRHLRRREFGGATRKLFEAMKLRCNCGAI